MPKAIKRPKISAIIASYKDELAIPFMYRRLKAVFRKIKVNHEIVYVNDGSPDNSKTVLTKLAAKDKKLVVINHTRNFGSQSAFTSGMKLATGDAVVLLDGDLQDPPELIEKFFYKWRSGYEVVYGIRTKRVAPRLMQLAYKAFYRLFRAMSYIPLPLDAGDFSLLDRKVVEAINSLPESNRFMRGLRSWVGFRQTGVAYVRPERMFGRTTNSIIKNFGWARKAIFSFSYIPLDLITLLAFMVVSSSAILIGVEILIRLFWPHLVPSGFTTVIILILFLGGVQLLCLGVVGSYIAHIYDEVKRRPPFIVESVLNRPKSRLNK